VAEDFAQQRLVLGSVQKVHAGYASTAGSRRVLEFRDHRGVERGAPFAEGILGLRHRELAHDGFAQTQRAPLGEVNDLERAHRLGHLKRHRVGVDAEGVALSVKPDRGNHRGDPFGEKKLEHGGLHALDPAGVEGVDAV
jgi:hypothetical protein